MQFEPVIIWDLPEDPDGNIAHIAGHGVSSLLKNSTGCVIAWMRSQNSDASRYFASRAELCSAPGEVEKRQEGVFQRTVSPEEVEEVLEANAADWVFSRSTKRPITFGYTLGGRYLAVVWDHIGDDPLTVYPVTAYDAPEPRRCKGALWP